MRAAEAISLGESTLSMISPSARLDSEVLLSFVLATPRQKLLLEAPYREVSDDEQQQFTALIERRKEREPVAYLVGEREFWSLPFIVTRDVLVPRPETELLVERGLRALKSFPEAPLRFADLGTGSGCVAVALAHELSHGGKRVRGIATDISEPALKVARHNSERHGVGSLLDFRCGSWCEPLAGEKGLHLILSNPPYIPLDDPFVSPETAFEPRQALYSGKDGLDAVREILRDGVALLVPGGTLILEVGFNQRAAVEAAARMIATKVKVRWQFCRDLAGMDRVLELVREG